MVHLAYPQRNREAIKGELADHLDKGKAFECFRQIVEAQGGDVKTFEYPSKLVNAKIQMPVFPEGQQNVPTIKAIDVRALGMAILLLGGGRRKTDDSIDHSVGMTNLKHVGDTLEGEEPLCMVYGNDDALVQEASLMIRKAYTFE
jgi:thymidine phosphorylase